MALMSGSAHDAEPAGKNLLTRKPAIRVIAEEISVVFMCVAFCFDKQCFKSRPVANIKIHPELTQPTISLFFLTSLPKYCNRLSLSDFYGHINFASHWKSVISAKKVVTSL